VSEGNALLYHHPYSNHNPPRESLGQQQGANMFKRSSLGSAKNFPGGRRDAQAFQELRQIVAEDGDDDSIPEIAATKPHAVEEARQLDPFLVCEAADNVVRLQEKLACTCPPEPEHDHDVATAEGEGMPSLKNNCTSCFPA